MVLTVLDFSAAFDKLEHDILLRRLGTDFGICDSALLLDTFLPKWKNCGGERSEISSSASGLWATTRIRSWMEANMIKLNGSKTEFMVIGSKDTIAKVTVDIDNLFGCVIQLLRQPVLLGHGCHL